MPACSGAWCRRWLLSLRGKPGYAHFAAAKAGPRMIAQRMAREYGTQGIHVAHVIIDGGIDGERLRAFRPQIVDERAEDGMLNIGPALLPASMSGDRAFVIFAAPQEISAFIQAKC